MTKRFAALLVIACVVSFVVPAADEAPWTWAGVEIMGNHKVPRADLEKMIPIPIGGEYHTGDAPFWIESCTAIDSKYGFAATVCSERPLLVFIGHKVYVVVDIVEKGHEDLLKFGEAPSSTVPFANDEMVRISAELSAKLFAAGTAGHMYDEHGDKGYLTYSDKSGTLDDLTPQVQRLAQLVPQYRDNVLAVLHGEKDPKKRREAAVLLNWSGGDLEKTLRDALPYLNDPDAGVRNNVSRFMIQFVGKVKSKKVRHQLIDAFIVQISRPSHGDRNKGIYNLLGIANAWPADRGYIRTHGGESIRYLAENSILFNVQPPAQELLALIDQS